MEFKCPLCSAAFYHKRYLTDHNRRVHGEKIRTKQILCTHCSESFSSETSLKKHVSNFHTKKEHIASVQCQEENCLAKFRTVCDFREHLIATHEIEGIDNKQEYDFENYSGMYIKLLLLSICLFCNYYLFKVIAGFSFQ